jgi:RNA polymerase sigma-70 factor (ECF subfamily)
MDVDLKACIDGDKRAWDAFVERWAGVLLAAVGRTMRGRLGAVEQSDIDDAVQDVFVRLIRNDCRLLRSYDPARASLSTWLTLVARSAAIDRLRRRDPPGAALPPDLAAPGPRPSGPDRAVPWHVLTARQRLVLRLLFDEEKTVPEAARFLGVDEQTVRSAKHKALTRLREHLAKAEGRGTGAAGGDAGAAGPVEQRRDPS